ncbi:allantoate amidohydrolase [Dermacoccus nishinomiyaensis]|uniref:allantoate amidohydrolase n=1 Tax=Dermacoccus TaxID=57495 RepID=UPI0001E63E8D|nr:MULTISPECIES: allantoate amidohydrolase [Dermacoccus]EFP58162.1 allantoate amidohydrolase [Dermacoccus sp. Ellin185]MCT1604286.1 allantoate amidohydrolase [Dermacoccus nishinomiyaensis]NHC32597.1 allantoate amidohydrolase [Dermacoccus nishinomiyaensis]TJZ97673.1 allantoate amidohydrolase [Dermacoccus nishinomiyaensis]
MTERTFEGLWADLAPVGRDKHSGGYRRFAWSREDSMLREWFDGECEALGLDVVEDRAGNQWAWWGEPDRTPGVATGSHLDSVPDGGAFDGPLGVVSSLLAVRRLKESGFAPARPIGVVNFVDEEGARFGVACAGSRLITGAVTAERALGLRDTDGVTMAQAWERAGREPSDLGRDDAALARLACFVEVHVEQGRALVDLPRDAAGDPFGAAVAVGTDIWPHGRFRADLPGHADHAGTTALGDRDDALVKAARFIEQVRAAATSRDDGAARRVVATVGKLDVTPGGINAIASHVTAWVDARGVREDDVRAAIDEIAGRAAELGGEWREESWTPTTPFDADLVARVHRTLGEGVPMLGTGAGHDAGILANHGIPSVMLFVRNPTGTSHSPEEFAQTDDCLRGVDALVRVLEDLAS